MAFSQENDVILIKLEGAGDPTVYVPVAADGDATAVKGIASFSNEDFEVINGHVNASPIREIANEAKGIAQSVETIVSTGALETALSVMNTHNTNPTAHSMLFADKVDKSQTVNGKALSTNIVLSYTDVGAVSYTEYQSISDTQKMYARTNINVDIAGTALSAMNTHNTNPTAHSSLFADKVTKNTAITGATKPKITYDEKGLVTGGADLLSSDIPDLSASYIPQSVKGAASGVASLDSNGKVPLSQVNDSILGQVEYIGIWNALTGESTVDLRTPSGRAYRNGDYYIIGTAGSTVTSGGSYGGTAFEVGDWMICNGTLMEGTVPIWGKVDNTDAVSSVNAKTGAVVLNASDVNAVSTEASQGLTDTQKANARINIGAGTSSFSGAYGDLTDRPTIPTVDQIYSAVSANAQSGAAVAAAIAAAITATLGGNY